MKYARKNQFIFTYHKINLKKFAYFKKMYILLYIAYFDNEKKNEDYPFKDNPHSQLKTIINMTE